MSAPTLLEQLVTSQAFWGFLLVAAFAGLLYHTTEILKTWHAHDAEDDAEQGPPASGTCAIDGCINPAATAFFSPTGVLFVCRDCSGRVAEWTGPAINRDEAS